MCLIYFKGCPRWTLLTCCSRILHLILFVKCLLQCMCATDTGFNPSFNKFKKRKIIIKMFWVVALKNKLA